MNGRLKVAVVGAGHFGKHHVRILSGLPEVDLVGVCDPDGARAKELAEKFGSKPLSSVAELPPDLDAAVVAVPTRLHAEVAVPLLARGVSCLVEKPLARNVEEAEAICAAAERSGAILGVGHVERFNPALVAAGKRVANPRFIECRRIAPFSFRSSDVGVVLDLMIHDLDVCLALVRSEVTRVDACGTPVLGLNEDIANARLAFACGCVADITASRVATKTERKIRVFCPDTYMSLDFGSRTGEIFRKSPQLTPEYVKRLCENAQTIADLKGMVFGNLLTVEHLSLEEKDPLTAELADFVQAVRTRGMPTVSGRDGYRAVEVAVRILEAIGTSPVLH